MEARDRIRKEIERDTKTCWLYVLCFLAALTVALYVYVTLFSLWIFPIDSFIPVKVASAVGCGLFVAYTMSRVLVIFDSQAESWNRFVAGLFLFVTLGTLYVLAETLPDLADFLTSATLRMDFLPSNLMVKVMISIGMIVVLMPFVLLVRTWRFELTTTMLQIYLNKKRLRGEA
jgi:hypothetical protein